MDGGEVIGVVGFLQMTFEDVGTARNIYNKAEHWYETSKLPADLHWSVGMVSWTGP